MKSSIFISYKRNYSSIEANVINYALQSHGFITFLDVLDESLGYFPAHIEKNIKLSKYFLLICTKNSMDSLSDKSDWVRKEIEIVNQENSNNPNDPITIIPLYFPGFDNTTLNVPDINVNLFETQAIEVKYPISNHIINLIKKLHVPVKKDQLSSIILKSFQSDLKCEKISNYILNSSEMDLPSNTEIYLLTNDLIKYDFNVVAKMAVSKNIRKNVRYTYYIHKDCVLDFSKFYNEIREYGIKTNKALIEIEQWIRYTYISPLKIISQIDIWFSLVQQKGVDYFLQYFRHFENVESLLEFVSVINQNNLGTREFDFSMISHWLHGNEKTTVDIKAAIKALIAISKIIVQHEINDEDGFTQEWCKNIGIIEKIYDIVNWIYNENNKKSNEEIRRNFKDFGINYKVYNWLCEEPIPINEIEASLDNLNAYVLADNLKIDIYYNFSLFYSSNKVVSASSWYMPIHRIVDKMNYDNDVIVCDMHSEQLINLQNVFLWVHDFSEKILL